MKSLFGDPVEPSESRKLEKIGRQRSAWKMQPRGVIPGPVPEREDSPMWEGVSTSEMRHVEHHLWLANRMNYARLLMSGSIEIDPDIRSGVPVMRGTRVPLSQVLAEIADGASIEVIADDLEIDETPIREFIQSFSIFVDQPSHENFSVGRMREQQDAQTTVQRTGSGGRSQLPKGTPE